LGKIRLGALLFSILVSVIFTIVLSYTAEMGLWMGLTTFLMALLLFFGIIILATRRGETERVSQMAELRRMQAYDLKEDDL
jgi:uncharacterized membrane protein YagU involved in acid resistance